MRIYTKSGDLGQTGLIGGDRVGKDHVRVEAVGAIDEFNAALGIARLHPDAYFDPWLESLQNRLFDVGAEVATPTDSRFYRIATDETQVTALEASIDEMTAELEPLRNFILLGGSALAAHLHSCRTLCRRAERAVLRLHRQEPVADVTLRYLNRLSDWFFTAARYANHRAGVAETVWKQEQSKP